MSCLPSIPAIGNTSHGCARGNRALSVSDPSAKTVTSTQVLNRLQSLCYEPSIPEESRQKLLAVLSTLQSSSSNTPNAASPQPNTDGLPSPKPAGARGLKSTDIHAPLWHRVNTKNDTDPRSRVEGFNLVASPFKNFVKSKSLNKRSLPVLQDHTETFAIMNRVMCQTMRYVESISELEFDINDVREYDNSVMVDKERLFMSVCCSVFANFSLTTTLGLDIERLTNFLIDIFTYYSKDHYFYTALHAADALQMLSLFFREPNTNFLFTDDEILMAFLSILCFDIAHPALHYITLVELNHPLITVFGNLSVKKQASLIVFLHRLFLEENFFLTSSQSMLHTKNLLQEYLNAIVIFTSSKFSSYLISQLRCIATSSRIDGDDILYLLSALTQLSFNSFAFRPRKQWMFWGGCLHAEWRREEEERRRRWLDKLFPNLNSDARSGVSMVVDYCASTVKPLADAVRTLVPTDLYDNLEQNLDLAAIEAEMTESARGVFSPLKALRPWGDHSAFVFEILRRTTAHATSLDRKASKCAILNASPQRSMERQNSLTHLSLHPSVSDVEVDCARGGASPGPTPAEHYFSFLRLYDEFERAGRPSAAFAGQLLFFALQLDPGYVGRYAREAFGEDCRAPECAAMAAMIRAAEEPPSTAEAIASRRAGGGPFAPAPDDANATDGFLLLLLHMYAAREEEAERLMAAHSLREEGDEGEGGRMTSPPPIPRRPREMPQQDSPVRLPVNSDTSNVRNAFTMHRLIPNLERND